MRRTGEGRESGQELRQESRQAKSICGASTSASGAVEMCLLDT